MSRVFPKSQTSVTSCDLHPRQLSHFLLVFGP